MASSAQIEANRRNALLSTGPKTDAGKAVASHNAVTHGLHADVAVIEGEDPEAFERFSEQLTAELAPVGLEQELLAEQIVRNWWKLRRVGRLEQATIARLQQRNRYPGEASDAIAAIAEDLCAP